MNKGYIAIRSDQDYKTLRSGFMADADQHSLSATGTIVADGGPRWNPKKSKVPEIARWRSQFSGEARQPKMAGRAIFMFTAKLDEDCAVIDGVIIMPRSMIVALIDAGRPIAVNGYTILRRIVDDEVMYLESGARYYREDVRKKQVGVVMSCSWIDRSDNKKAFPVPQGAIAYFKSAAPVELDEFSRLDDYSWMFARTSKIRGWHLPTSK